MFIVYDATGLIVEELKTVGDILKTVLAVFRTYEDAYNYILEITNGILTDVSDEYGEVTDEYGEVTEDYENAENPCIVAVLGNDDKIFYVQYIDVNMLIKDDEFGEMFKALLEEPL